MFHVPCILTDEILALHNSILGDRIVFGEKILVLIEFHGNHKIIGDLNDSHSSGRMI